MFRMILVALSSCLVLMSCVPLFSEEQSQPRSVDPQLIYRLKAAQSATEAHPLLEELNRDLGNGYFLGQEVEIARATLRFWKDPATPKATLQKLFEIYTLIAGALVVMEPDLAQEILLRAPISWLKEKDPEKRRMAFDVLSLSWNVFFGLEDQEKAFLQAIPTILNIAATLPEEDFEAVMSLLAEQIASTEAHLFDSMPQAFVERLRSYRGPHAGYLSGILALDPTNSGTQNLIAFAINPPPLPPEQAQWIDRQRQREAFLEKLEKRHLTLEQKGQVVSLLADPGLQRVVFSLVRNWWYRGEPLPPPPLELLPKLEEWAIQEQYCEEAVRLLAAAGTEGVKRLFRLVAEDRRDWNAPIRNPRPCEGDRWGALFGHADKIADQIEKAYRQNPAPWHLRLLARAGRWEVVLEALSSPDVALRREAAFLLSLAVAPEEDELTRTGSTEHGGILVESWKKRPELHSRAREMLRQALRDEDLRVQREAFRALLYLGNGNAWSELLKVLRMENENQFQIFLSGFHPILTDSIAFAIAQVAQRDSNAAVRRRATYVLRLARPGPWRALVEGQLRSLLNDPDPEVRRAVAEYFATAPAQEVATTAALLEATQDVFATALGLARGWTPELVAHLETRLKAGDPDDNVVRGLEGAYLNALRREPGSVDRLLAIVLDRKGPARWRKALAEGPQADEAVARALLERLEARPLNDWAPMPKFDVKDMQQMLEFMVRAEEDPPPLTIISHLVPSKIFDPWLIRRALDEPKLSIEHRLWLIQQTQMPESLRENVWRLIVQGLREEKGDQMVLALLGKFGFAGVRRLLEELWDEPETLQRVARYLRRQENLGKLQVAAGNTGGPYLPRPTVEDLPWIKTMLSRIKPGTHDPRLESLVELANIWDLGNNPTLRKAAFQAGVPQLLIQYMNDPKECEVVRHAVGSLFHRSMLPPPCPLRSH